MKRFFIVGLAIIALLAIIIPAYPASAITLTPAQIKLQGNGRPFPEGYFIPLNVKVYEPGTELTLQNIYTEESIGEGYTISFKDVGPMQHTLTFDIWALPQGTFTVAIFAPKCLVNVVENIEINGTTLDFGTLLFGNINGDAMINGADYGIMLNDYWSKEGDPEWNGGRSDLDENGIVSSSDLSLLGMNYNRFSPIFIE